MLAWAGLTLGAPIDNTELIVNKVVIIMRIMEIMMLVIITTTRTKTTCYYNDSQVMDSLGPQLDSAIEAAIRMLEGNAGAGRHGLPDDEDDDDH